jgi:hypothetical protein
MYPLSIARPECARETGENSWPRHKIPPQSRNVVRLVRAVDMHPSTISEICHLCGRSPCASCGRVSGLCPRPAPPCCQAKACVVVALIKSLCLTFAEIGSLNGTSGKLPRHGVASSANPRLSGSCSMRAGLEECPIKDVVCD